MKKTIDLRSDTVTLPCNKMYKAMCEAKLGDEFYDDKSITRELEDYCANFFGKESALFMTSGTLANQVAIRAHTSPGDDIITERTYHINYYESAPTADLGKVVLNTVESPEGILNVASVEKAASNKNRSFGGNDPSLIVVENTINYHVGKIFPLEELQQLYSYATQKNINLHIDGARLLNASVASGISAAIYAEYAHSLMVSFNKGLGAPFGAILLGTHEFIAKTKKYRKWYGGGLHQSGLMAAAALYALKNNIPQLSVDHRNAKLLANQLSKCEKLELLTDSIETNIVMFNIQKYNIDSLRFVEMAEKIGILLYPWDQYNIRAVTHKDVSENDITVASQRLLESLDNETATVKA